MNRVFVSFLFLVVVLSGCSGVFKDADTPPLEGERVSILQFQKDLQPEAILSSDEITLPDEWKNKYWPQTGGYPNHAMGHLSLAKKVKKHWSVSIGKGGDRRQPLISQPVVADGLIYSLDTEAQISAFDIETGKRIWKKNLTPKGEEKSGALGGGISYSQGQIFVTTGYRNIVSLHPKTGKTLWTKTAELPIRAAPAVMGGRVFVATLGNQLLAYDAENGEALWNYNGLAQATNLLGMASPAVSNDTVIVAFSSGELFALRTENGQMIWSDNLSSLKQGGAISGISDINGLPVVDKGMVYAIGFNGRMIAIDERTGQRVWQREISGSETPWAVGEMVFVLTSNQQLVALERHNGHIRWVSELPKINDNDKDDIITWTGPIFAGGRLIIASNKKHIVEINPQNGDMIRKWKAAGEIFISPVVAGSTLYLLENNGRLVAYK